MVAGRFGAGQPKMKSDELRAGQGSQLLSVQYLRAVAAILVVLFHQLQGRNPLFRLGSHGVDLFFVISGFIMIAITDGRPITPARFMLDRIARIAPMYWIATGAAVLWMLAIGHFYEATVSPVDILRSLFFIPSFNAHGRLEPTIYLGWTLNYEMFFYTAFALTLFLPTRLRLPVLTGAALASVLVGRLTHPQNAVGITYSSPIILNFVAGAWLGRAYGFRLIGSYVRMMSGDLAVILALAACALLYRNLIYGVAASAVLAAFLMAEKSKLLPRSAVLLALGNASYSTYLFQQLAFEGVDILKVHSSTLQRHASFLQLADITAAVGLGLLAYLFVQRPVTAAARRLIKILTGQAASLKPEAA